MILCRAVGSVWSTKKYGAMDGLKLLLCEVAYGRDAGRMLVCVDTVGAGVDELVIVAQGWPASGFLEQRVIQRKTPVDALVVGIVDDDWGIDLREEP